MTKTIEEYKKSVRYFRLVIWNLRTENMIQQDRVFSYLILLNFLSMAVD